MPRPEHGEVRGPMRPSLRDIEPLNRVFSEAFTDRYRRDGLMGVRVPHLNPQVWRYAMEDAAEGAMLWRDGEDDRIVAFNMVHRSGTEGWMGPLAVRPDRQREGLGKRVVRAGIAWLRQSGAQTIGLETMPRTVENIGFYSRLGFVPGPTTVTMIREVSRADTDGAGLRWSAAGRRRAALLKACRELTERLAPGIDFTRELELTAAIGVGDTTLILDGTSLVAFALWHSAPLAEGRPKEELRVLKVVAQDRESLARLLAALETEARRERVPRVGVRCQADVVEAYRLLVERNYQVHWTDLRMTLARTPPPARTGLVLSNWEI